MDGGPAPGGSIQISGTIVATESLTGKSMSIGAPEPGVFGLTMERGIYVLTARSDQYNEGRIACPAVAVEVLAGQITEAVISCPIR